MLLGDRVAGIVSARRSLPETVLNAATHATVADLIAMQRHAGTVDLTHARSARAKLAGNHLSRFRGRGMDYQESRLYQAGDDVRSMDWRVTARTGSPHVKIYQEERERPVVLFLDLNPGMFFGSRGTLKSVVAARAAALIAWAAAAHGDRVGALLSNGGYSDLQPRGGRHGVLRLIRQVVAHTDPRVGINAQAHVDCLNAALGRLRHVSRPGSLIILIGDFYGIDDESRKLLLSLRQHSDVAAIQIVDPLEEAPPAPARYGVVAGGAPGILDLRSNAARRAYDEHFRRHHLAVAAVMRAGAISLLRLSTGDELVSTLQRQFAAGVAQPQAGRRAA
jgi:uncharacterized protein (DUF58 family)